MSDIHDDDSEKIELSGTALDALKEFYADRDAREKQFEDLKTAAADDEKAKTISMETFEENWNESQFWYSQETADILARQLLAGCTNESTIAVVSAPSVYVQLKNIIASSELKPEEIPKMYLLEFDERFSIFPEFVFYDFQKPFKLPVSMKGSIDYIICDPPFLSEDCQTKTAMTVRWLSKSWGSSAARDEKSSPSEGSGKLIVCTGERMENLVNKLYRPQGIHTTTFEPAHSKGLSNEFYCYSNFECGDWKWRS